MKKKNDRRILGRQLAKELTEDDLKKISGSGGTTSCCCPYGADDCDQPEIQY